MKIKAVLFDLVGTLIKEENPNFIIESFQQTFKENGLSVNIELIKSNRGRNKREIIDTILIESNQPLNLNGKIITSFNNIIEQNLDNFSLMDGVKEVFSFLKENKIKVGLGTGLPKDLVTKILIHLKIKVNDFDFLETAEETGKGRPDPAMIFKMMNKFNIDKSEFLKVGDTKVDIQEGKNAGVKTVAILSGTQNENDILSEKPDYVIKTLKDLEGILRRINL